MDANCEFLIKRYQEQAKKKNQVVTLFLLTHNRENYVKLMIKSILKQTYSNFQLIVLDNESSDNTKKSIESIEDNRVLYIYRKSVIGDSNTEFALKNCVTDYFIILHDDDELEKEYLEIMLNYIKTTNYDAVSCSAKIIDEDGNIYDKWCKIGDSYRVWKAGEYLAQFFDKNTIGMIYPSVIYKRDFYKNFTYFGGDPTAGPAGDQVIWFQTEKTGGIIAFLNLELYRYRIYKNQESYLHMGYMILQLVDYLSEDSFYSAILEKKRRKKNIKVLRAYTAISKKYYMNRIDDVKYSEIFNYKAIINLKHDFQGCIFYCFIIFTYKIRYILKKVLGCILNE